MFSWLWRVCVSRICSAEELAGAVESLKWVGRLARQLEAFVQSPGVISWSSVRSPQKNILDCGLVMKHVSFARGSKTGSSTGWIRCLLGGLVFSPPKHLLQLRCSNVDTHQTNTELARRSSNKSLWTVYLVLLRHRILGSLLSQEWT